MNILISISCDVITGKVYFNYCIAKIKSCGQSGKYILSNFDLPSRVYYSMLK